MSSEKIIQTKIMLEAPKRGCVLFRNNSGMFKDSRGKWVRFGVGRPGGSDLIGWQVKTYLKKPIVAVFTRHLPIGQAEIPGYDDYERRCVFLAIEVKIPGKKPTKEQQNFIDQVKASGGIAGVCRSVEDFIRLIS